MKTWKAREDKSEDLVGTLKTDKETERHTTHLFVWDEHSDANGILGTHTHTLARMAICE